MCGSEATIRIERVGNGFTIDAYTPGGKDKPGKHKRSVATNAASVVNAVGAHLGKGSAKGKTDKGGRGVRLLAERGDGGNASIEGKKKAGKKKKSYKR